MSSPPPPRVPRVAGNDWRSLTPPALAGWTPTRSVSVVVLARRDAPLLPYTLAALAAARYPAHLLEVVVVVDAEVGDGLPMPDHRPERTRVVRADGPGSRADRWHAGAAAADGEVLHWLEGDVVPHAEEVAAQLRWHHVCDDAVVVGVQRSVHVGDPLPELAAVLAAVADGPGPARSAGRDGDEPHLFAGLVTTPDPRLAERLARTDDLTREPASAFLAHDGSAASVSRALYLDSGGMDPALRLGEHLELGYRLAQQGAVFVPEPHARSWRLHGPCPDGRQAAIDRYRRPFLGDRVPTVRAWRTAGRSYSVPWVEVVVDTALGGYDDVRHSVDAVLAGEVADVEVALLGPWAQLEAGHRSPLLDPDRDLRMLAAEYAGERRVTLVATLPATGFPAPFRLHLPAGWAPAPDTVRRLVAEATRRDRGLVSVLLADGRVSRLERTSAVSRARRLARADGFDPDATGLVDGLIDGLVDEVSGSWWLEGGEEGFRPVSAPAARRPPATGDGT
ncbi:MAG: glycosyltransferase, partial [Nocardioidaceae bacterium]